VGVEKLDAETTYQAAIRLMPAQQSIELQYLRLFRRLPDLKQPKTFNEKVQRRKLCWADSRYPLLADKVRVKEFVAEKLGRDWLIPSLFSGPALPPRAERTWPVPFIMKANHGSGWNSFVGRTPTDIEWDRIEQAASNWMATPWPPHRHENFYNEIPRQILVEPLIAPRGQLIDLKCFAFNGRVEFVQVDTDRFVSHKRNFYDREWRLQDFALAYPRDQRIFPRPQHLEQILAAAETLAAGFPFVRIDFYDFASGPKFGEITFTPEGGLGRFEPESADLLFGSLWPEPSI
jgi:hypothetical protein